MLIYLDNCCYARPYDNQDQIRIHLETLAKLEIQRMVVNREIDLAVSGFLFYENGKKKDEDIKVRIASYMDKYLSIYIEDDDPELAPLIEEIELKGIKPLDASHLAAAIVAGCDYFITTDDRILNCDTDRLRIVNPLQFIAEVE